MDITKYKDRCCVTCKNFKIKRMPDTGSVAMDCLADDTVAIDTLRQARGTERRLTYNSETGTHTKEDTYNYNNCDLWKPYNPDYIGANMPEIRKKRIKEDSL